MRQSIENGVREGYKGDKGKGIRGTEDGEGAKTV